MALLLAQPGGAIAGAGSWSAYLLDKATGKELVLEQSGWRASMGRTKNAVSVSSVVLDPEYATFLGRTPRPWLDELVLRRGDDLAWVGPVITVDDSDPSGVTWVANDRMVYVLARRPFWRTQTFTGEITRLFTLCLASADHGDPTGLRRDPRPKGVISSISPTAGDKVGTSIGELQNALEWTVAGDVVRYGQIEIFAEEILPADSWAEDRPSLRADGLERLTHVVAVTENHGRVWYPSADPYDRPEGSPLLVDTIEVGDLTAVQAQQVARQLYLGRQGEIFVVNDSDRPINANFPLAWKQMIPGAVLDSSVRGRALFTESQPMALASLTVDIADGQEIAINPVLEEAAVIGNGFLGSLGRFISAQRPDQGTVVPDTEIFPFNPLGTDWSEYVPPDAGFIGGGDGSGGFGDDGEFIGGGGWDGGGFGSGSGSGAGPYSPFDPGGPLFPDGPFSPFPADPYSDPFANCPPQQCCQLCGGGGGGSGTGKIWVSSSIRLGATTWTAADGDTRTLNDRPAEHASDGGLLLEADNLMFIQIHPQDTSLVDMPSGVARYIFDISTHWTVGDAQQNTQLRIGEWNGMWGIVPKGWWNGTTTPASLAIVDFNAGDPTSNWILLDSAPLGVEDWGRCQVRVDYNQSTGATSGYLRRSANDSWTLQGSSTFTAGTAGAGVDVLFDNTIDFYPVGWGANVLHALSVQQGNSRIHGWDVGHVDNWPGRFTPGVNQSQQVTLGTSVINQGASGDAGVDSDAAVCPLGAPLLMAPNEATKVSQPIWDSAPLVDPVIAVAQYSNPGLIEIVEEDPSTFTGVFIETSGADYGGFVYAVADRSTFTDIDSNGWPAGWWPFGPRIA